MTEKPIIETKSPFVVKVYDTFFHVSWDGLTDKPEDQYPYNKIKSVTIKRGKNNKIMEAIDIVFTMGMFGAEESDEMIIEFKTGEKETRYLQSESSDKIIDAVDLIKSKIGIKQS